MPKPRAIRDDEDFPIKPADINTRKHLFDAFDNMESEISASYILRFMQEKGEWVDFTFAELNDFYKKKLDNPQARDYLFNHLIGAFPVCRHGETHYEILDVIVRVDEAAKDEYSFPSTARFRVTDQFIMRSYMAAGIPRQRKEVAA